MPIIRLALVVLLTAGISVGDSREPVSVRVLEGGVELLTYSYGTLGLFTVHVLRFQPQAVEPRFVAPPPGKTLSLVSEMPACAEAVACFNASFFEAGTDRPIGLIVSEGKLVQRMKKTSWGAFWLDGQGKAHVTGPKAFRAEVDPAKDVQFGIQSTPMLVVDGAGRKPSDAARARRTVMGADSLGRILVAVFPFPIAHTDVVLFAKERLDAVQLMNLDGGSSTQLVLPGQGGPLVSGVPVANGIGLFQKSTGDVRNGGGSPMPDSR
jgi:hypothetical protein